MLRGQVALQTGVDEKTGAIVCMVALFSVCGRLLCVLSVHFIILATPKKRSDFPVALLGVISFPCVVDICCLFPK